MAADEHIVQKGFVITLMIVALGLGCALIGFESGRTHVKREAVKNGNAQYVPDENGAAKFEWKR